MQFLVFSKEEAKKKFLIEGAVGDRPMVWISILDPDSKDFIPFKTKGCKGVCQLHFHDVSSEDMEQLGDDCGMGWVKPSETDAQRIVKFMSRHKDIEVCAIHCEAGISRSSATAAALSLWVNGHDAGVFADPRFHPNRILFGLLKNEIEKLGEWNVK